MDRAHIRGVDIHYDTGGLGASLVWGHGLMSSRAQEDEFGLIDWSEARRHVSVLRYDARGHGESGFTVQPEAYRWDALALDQLELADHLGMDDYVAGGASMGAATALHAACMAPDRVKGLVLMIPPTAWETRAEQVDMYEVMSSTIERRTVEPLISARADVPLPDPIVGRTDWSERMERFMRAADPMRLVGLLRGAGFADFPTREEVASISVPTLVLAWSGDAGHPLTTANELGSLMKGSDVVVASTWDELQQFGKRIVSFTGDVETR
jgi:3-oxoadipate enol-lactonase